MIFWLRFVGICLVGTVLTASVTIIVLNAAAIPIPVSIPSVRDAWWRGTTYEP